MIRWHIANKRRISELYAEKSNVELAEIFNTTVKSIEGIAGRLELKKPRETRKAIMKEAHSNRTSEPFVEHNGVMYIYMPEHPSSDSRGYISEHRLVMEEKLQRQLDETEIVVHKNGDKSDNDPDNLEVKYYYKRDVSPIDVYNDRMNGMSVKEIKEKYDISNNTYYRKLEEGARLLTDGDYEGHASPADVYMDMLSGMPIKEIVKKYKISSTTYYRKLKRADELILEGKLQVP